MRIEELGNKLERLFELHNEGKISEKTLLKGANFLLFEIASLKAKDLIQKYLDAQFKNIREEIRVFYEIHSYLEGYIQTSAFFIFWSQIAKLSALDHVQYRITEIENLVRLYNLKHTLKLQFSKRKVDQRTFHLAKSLLIRLVFRKEVDPEWLDKLINPKKKPRTSRDFQKAVKQGLKGLPRSVRAKILEELSNMSQIQTVQ